MSQERRQFYRVEKNVALEVQRVTPEEANHSSKPAQFEVSPYFELLSDAQEIDKQQANLLIQLNESQPLLAELFSLQSKKLELITRTLANSGLKIERLTKQSVNLSEGGMQFVTSDNIYHAGDFIEIKLIFSNPLLGVLLYAKVQRVITDEDNFHIAISFHRMPENCRMLIAQRVIQTQPVQLPETDQ